MSAKLDVEEAMRLLQSVLDLLDPRMTCAYMLRIQLELMKDGRGLKMINGESVETPKSKLDPNSKKLWDELGADWLRFLSKLKEPKEPMPIEQRCLCSNLAPSKRPCVNCRAEYGRKRQERLERWHKEGRCSRCGKIHQEKSRMCEPCKTYAREYERARKLARGETPARPRGRPKKKQ